MSKKRTKKRAKSRKPNEVIRTDVWDLKLSAIQKQQLILTVDEYRNFLKPLVLIINAQWVSLGGLTATERVNAVEEMIHKTTGNPDPRHSYFQKVVNRYPSSAKIPQLFKTCSYS